MDDDSITATRDAIFWLSSAIEDLTQQVGALGGSTVSVDGALRRASEALYRIGGAGGIG